MFIGVDLSESKDQQANIYKIPKKDNFISIEDAEKEIIIKIIPKNSEKKNIEFKVDSLEEKLRIKRLEKIKNCEETRILLENTEKLDGISYKDWNNLKEIMDVSFREILKEQNEHLNFNANRERLDIDILCRHTFEISKANK